MWGKVGMISLDGFRTTGYWVGIFFHSSVAGNTFPFLFTFFLVHFPPFYSTVLFGNTAMYSPHQSVLEKSTKMLFPIPRDLSVSWKMGQSGGKSFLAFFLLWGITKLGDLENNNVQIICVWQNVIYENVFIYVNCQMSHLYTYMLNSELKMSVKWLLKM